MSGVSLPVSRPAGRAMVVSSIGCRREPVDRLERQGFQCGEVEDPYTAVAELARRSSAYQCIVLSLQSLYREELTLISTIKRRWPHLDIWLTQTDGRSSALAEAMCLGADGLLTEEGLVRTAVTNPPAVTLFRPSEEPVPVKTEAVDPGPQVVEEHRPESFLDDPTGEPVLTPEELQALLQEPSSPNLRRND